MGVRPRTKNLTDTIQEHILREGWISPQEAWALYGCMRLAPRIHELRNRGFSISTQPQTARYRARYVLEVEPA